MEWEIEQKATSDLRFYFLNHSFEKVSRNFPEFFLISQNFCHGTSGFSSVTTMSTDSTSTELDVALEPIGDPELNEVVIFPQPQPTSNDENQNDEPSISTQNSQKPETTGLVKLLESCDTSNYPYPILGALAILIRVISYIFIFASCLICAKIALCIALIKFCFTQKSEENRFSNIIKDVWITLLGALLIFFFFLITIPLTFVIGVLALPFSLVFFKKQPFTDIYLFIWENCETSFKE